MPEGATTTADTTAATATTTTATASTVAAPWYGTPDADTATYITSRGLDKMDAKDAFLATVKAHQSAVKSMSYPEQERLRYKPDDAQVMQDFYARLGVPKDINGYDFSDVKLTDGSELDQSFTDTLRKTAFDNRLTPAQTKQVASALVQWVEQQDKAELTETQTQINAERDALKRTWGNSYDANLLYAREGAKLAFNGDTETAMKVVAALEKTAGYSATMEHFRKVGMSLREPASTSGTSNWGINPSGELSAEQAGARKAELMADKAWVQRWYTNGVNGPEAKELQNLDRILVASRAR
jgi:hypothetical protein